jgi:hypothetical protein
VVEELLVVQSSRQSWPDGKGRPDLEFQKFKFSYEFQWILIPLGTHNGGITSGPVQGNLGLMEMDGQI